MVATRHACVPLDLIADERLTPLAVRVYAAVAAHANKAKGNLAWPAVETLAEIVHRGLRQVREALRLLVETGWLAAARRGVRGHHEWRVSATLSGEKPPLNDAHTLLPEQTTEQTPAEAASETPLDRPFQEPDLGVQDAKMTANRRTPPPDQPALLPTEAEAPKPTAQHLVAAWVDGYRQTFGEEPQPAMMKRVAGQCGRLGKTCETVEHWRRAWRACRVAGAKNRPDAVPFLAADNPPSLYSTKQGVGTMVRSLAQRRADLLAEQQAQIEQVTR